MHSILQKDLLMHAKLALCVLLAALAGPTAAQMKVGATMGLSGPTSTVLAPHKMMWDIMDRDFGGVPYTLAVQDDQANPNEAVKLARRFVSEDKVDLLVVASTLPVCLAIVDVAVESKTPLMCMAAPVFLPKPRGDWLFILPPRTTELVRPAVEQMARLGAKTVAYIGFSDSLGDVHYKALEELAPKAGIRVVGNERYERNATTVAAQVLKTMSANPDAVYVGAAASPAVLPHVGLVERGYRKPIFHTNAMVVPQFAQLGGKNVEGAYAVTSPMYVAEQLPDSNPIKPRALELLKKWEAAYGKDRRSPFFGYSYDSYLLVAGAAPRALKKAKPGTPEFRQALRDAMEDTRELVGSSGVYTMTPTDHNGTDHRSVVLIRLENGVWKYVAR